MHQYASKYFVRRPPPKTLEWDQNSSFSEHGHAAYQIKGNEVKTNIEEQL